VALALRVFDYDSPTSFVSHLRRNRARRIVRLIDEITARRGECRILDLGGTAEYWRVLDRGYLAARKAKITLLNLKAAPVTDPIFISEVGDACCVEREDNSFDLVHSNSVIEHVGNWRAMERFAHEVRRLAPAYFVQTPNFWFPLEPHCKTPFFQFLPESVRAWMITRWQLGDFDKCDNIGIAMLYVQSANLLTRRQMRHLFPDAEHISERLLGLPKSLMAVRPPN